MPRNERTLLEGGKKESKLHLEVSRPQAFAQTHKQRHSNQRAHPATIIIIITIIVLISINNNHNIKSRVRATKLLLQPPPGTHLVLQHKLSTLPLSFSLLSLT